MMTLLSFYVPHTHLEIVKEAIFRAGAGKIGNYDQCCFEIQGQGQFRPLKGSKAFIGDVGKVEKVDEVKVEVIVLDEKVESVVTALKSSHPYETPAYFYISVQA